MTQLDELREFLRSRRARLTPADVDLPVREGSRRVHGLRREELALLAGVSVDYYARLEQGRARNVSEQVLDAVADALRLDTLERRHLFDLVRAVPKRRSGPWPPSRPRLALRGTIDAIDPVPAILLGPYMDVLAINRMGAILLDDFDAVPADERNFVRWMFLNSRARQVYPDWADIASQTVAVLRVAASRNCKASILTRMVDDISARSPEFGRYWADYRVSQHTHGTKHHHHEAVGTMTLNYETLILPADPGLSLIIYSADPGSPSEEKLRILASWSDAR